MPFGILKHPAFKKYFSAYYILHHDRKSRRFLYEGENSKTDLKEKWEALLLCRGEIKRPLFKKVVSTLPN